MPSFDDDLSIELVRLHRELVEPWINSCAPNSAQKKSTAWFEL